MSGSYTTTFPANENPLSEGGTWRFQNVAGKTPLQTSGGNCFPTDVGPGPDDSYAYLLGFGDSTIITTVFRSVSLLDANANSHEIEHLHRLTDDAGNTTAYEVDMAFHENGLFLARWSGAQSFVDLSSQLVVDTGGFPDGANGQFRDGYVVKTAWVGGQLNIYVDTGSGFVLYQHFVPGSDSVNDNPPLKTGDPGLGAFSPTASGDPSTWFGFKDALLSSNPMGRAIGSNAFHPGRSPGLGGISSARFQPSNWWPYSPPAVVAFDPAFMPAIDHRWPYTILSPAQAVTSGMTPPDQMPT